MRTNAYRPIQWVVLASLLAASIYRASTVSISMDEAYTYLSFVAPPFRQILTTYSPNHNVLYSLLAKVSVLVFGASELSLRIPALAGGVLIVLALFRLARAVLTSEWVMVLAAGIVAMNPMIFDYMSEARGYSLALAFYLFGLLASTRALPDESNRSRHEFLKAGVLLGLSVAAHLAFAIPAVALDLVLMAIWFRSSGKRIRTFLGWSILPQVLTASAILAGPLIHADRQTFVGGYASLFETFNNFSISCVLHDWDGNGFLTYSVNTWVSGYFYTIFRVMFLFAIGVALVLLARILRGSALNRYGRLRSNARSEVERKDFWLIVFAGTLIVSVVFVAASHIYGGLPYPFGRFVLYWWPLWVFMTCVLIERLRHSHLRTKSLSAVFVGFCLVMGIQSALEFDLDHFGWLEYSAGTRQAAETIRRYSVGMAGSEVSISTSGSLYACLDFYRSIWSMQNWRLTDRSKKSDGSDFIVLDVFDRPQGVPAGFTTIWQDQLSKAIVAVRSRKALAQLVPSPGPLRPVVSR